MIRGDKVLLADCLRVTAMRVRNGNWGETGSVIRFNGAGLDARRELAFGKGFHLCTKGSVSLSWF
ncbi:MAG: hypothetical protein CVT97_06645 [Bacteroidetes bacterium HGW-Bacteroidetes-14]|nr:MAG: hypothetical protein CVT97_06645 [Bacteroidetes bacterium HGW-Bacteroidetes-14]